METDREWIEGIREDAGKIADHIDPRFVDGLLSVYASDEDGRESIRQELTSLIGTFSKDLLLSKKPVLSFPSNAESEGDIAVGRVVCGEKVLWPFELTKEELNQHVLITGRSGSGKTTLIMHIIKGLMTEGIPFIIVDHKIDYRCLAREYQNIAVINWKDLKVNLLEPPPGVSFLEWKQQFLNIFGHVQGIWQGSTQYLLEAIDEVYEERKTAPRLEDVYKKIIESNETSRKMQEYASVVENRLYGILSKLGNTVNSEGNLIDIEKLLQVPVVLELHGLGRDEATILALWLFYWIYAYRRAQGTRGKLLHVLIIDEAKRVFTASEQYSQTTAEYSGIPPADLICDEIRDFGEAIIASDQEPTKLSNSLKANTYTKVTGFLGNGKDIDDMAEAMDLNEEEREAVTKLERGEWLVKLAGRYTEPFLMKSEDYPVDKNVGDAEIAMKTRPLIQKLQRAQEDGGRERRDREQQTLSHLSLSEDAWRLLLNVNAHPFKGIASRAKELAISASRLERAKKELISKKFVTQLDIPLTGRRPTSFLVLGNLALDYLESHGKETSLWKHVGHVGFEHVLYQVLIRWQMQKLGYEGHIEYKIGSRRIDVVAEDGKTRIGFEVELNPSPEIRHKLDGIESLDELYIVTRKELLDSIAECAGPLPKKVGLCSIESLLVGLRNLVSEYSGKSPEQENELESTVFSRNHESPGLDAGKGIDSGLGGKSVGK